MRGNVCSDGEGGEVEIVGYGCELCRGLLFDDADGFDEGALFGADGFALLVCLKERMIVCVVLVNEHLPYFCGCVVKIFGDEHEDWCAGGLLVVDVFPYCLDAELAAGALFEVMQGVIAFVEPL